MQILSFVNNDIISTSKKYLNDPLQNIVLRIRKEERNGGGEEKKKKKKQNRRKVTTNFDVSFMT